MIALSVMVEVHPEFADKYREAVMRHANNSLTKEKGCLHFTVHEHAAEPGRFFLYEAYATREDLENVHAVAPYLEEFGELTAPWIKAKQLERWQALEQV